MEKEQLKNFILEGVTETFEAFLFAEVMEEDLNKESIAHRVTSIPFFTVKQTFEYGPSGSITCFIPITLMEDAVDILLSEVEPDKRETMTIDCVLEFVNSIVGSIIGKIAGENVSFNLGLPELVEGEKNDGVDGLYGFNINEEIMLMEVTFE